jgi:hypothetical protein
MGELTNEMLEAIIVETVDTLPSELLASYRNPPGRKPHEDLLRIHSAIADMDDAAAEMLIRDVVDGVVFLMLYLMGAGFKDALTVAISRGAESECLEGAVLHEEYRMRIEPGGLRAER